MGTVQSTQPATGHVSHDVGQASVDGPGEGMHEEMQNVVDQRRGKVRLQDLIAYATETLGLLLDSLNKEILQVISQQYSDLPPDLHSEAVRIISQYRAVITGKTTSILEELRMTYGKNRLGAKLLLEAWKKTKCGSSSSQEIEYLQARALDFFEQGKGGLDLKHLAEHVSECEELRLQVGAHIANLEQYGNMVKERREHYAAFRHMSMELSASAAALLCLGAVVALLQFWAPGWRILLGMTSVAGLGLGGLCAGGAAASYWHAEGMMVDKSLEDMKSVEIEVQRILDDFKPFMENLDREGKVADHISLLLRRVKVYLGDVQDMADTEVLFAADSTEETIMKLLTHLEQLIEKVDDLQDQVICTSESLIPARLLPRSASTFPDRRVAQYARDCTDGEFDSEMLSTSDVASDVCNHAAPSASDSDWSFA